MNSANYSPQEMWNSGCQLGEWGRRSRDRQAVWGWPPGNHETSGQGWGRTAFQKVEKCVFLVITIIRIIVRKISG